MSDTFYARTPMPANTTPERCNGLTAFVAANFRPNVRIIAVSGSPQFYHLTVHLSPDDYDNDAALAALVTLYLSGDLVSIRAASVACGVTIKRISAAVASGQLRGYVNPDAPNPRKGRTLVSLAECRQMWGK